MIFEAPKTNPKEIEEASLLNEIRLELSPLEEAANATALEKEKPFKEKVKDYVLGNMLVC